MKCPVCGTENPQDKKYCGECGSMIAVAAPVQPKLYATEQSWRPYQVKVNLFCLVGAILGVLSLFMPWALLHDRVEQVNTNVGAFDFNQSPQAGYSFPDNFRYSVILFVIGTIVAFVLPLGGVLQLIGSMGFMLTTITYPSFGDTQVIFWIGAAIALISSIMVLIGFAYPSGVGYGTGRRTAMDRLLTVSLFR